MYLKKARIDRDLQYMSRYLAAAIVITQQLFHAVSVDRRDAAKSPVVATSTTLLVSVSEETFVLTQYAHLFSLYNNNNNHGDYDDECTTTRRWYL